MRCPPLLSCIKNFEVSFSSAGLDGKSVQMDLGLCRRSPYHSPRFNRSDENTAVRAAFACLRGDVSGSGQSYRKTLRRLGLGETTS